MVLPPPKRVEMGALYRVLRPMELSAGMRYTTSRFRRAFFEGARTREHAENAGASVAFYSAKLHRSSNWPGKDMWYRAYR